MDILRHKVADLKKEVLNSLEERDKDMQRSKIKSKSRKEKLKAKEEGDSARSIEIIHAFNNFRVFLYTLKLNLAHDSQKKERKNVMSLPVLQPRDLIS